MVVGAESCERSRRSRGSEKGVDILDGGGGPCEGVVSLGLQMFCGARTHWFSWQDP